ncbi:PREDICTED: atherin-like [Merops nubicus]|uniref:atherin-like n=1 Tax=Merops nubicus TaxID=57421 RepID=UPI0004F07094|nr:PREDICTED: atherin-like [Merops nubicus]
MFLRLDYKKSPSWPKPAPNEERGASADSRSVSTLCPHLTARPRAGSGPPARRARVGSAAAPPACPRSGRLQTPPAPWVYRGSIAPRRAVPRGGLKRGRGHAGKHPPLTCSQPSRLPRPSPPASRASSELPSATAIQPCRPGTWRPS